MARRTSLVELLQQYRSECRLSRNPAHNTDARDKQVEHIQRVQTWLWEDFDWPLLKVERNIELQSGQRYYDPPLDLDIDRLTKVQVWHDQALCDLCYGIEAQHYTSYNSDLDERQWPPQRWQITENEQMEIWPIPDTNYDATTLEGRMKLTGVRRLQPLVDDGDRADLDDRLIILFCAAEHLAATGGKDANMKLQQANSRYAKLRGAQQPRKIYSMFGIRGRDRRIERIPIAVYNSTS